MKPGTKVHEFDHHFAVDEGDGRPYRVAKHGLAHQTVQRIKRFAEGGEVKGDDPGDIDVGGFLKDAGGALARGARTLTPEDIDGPPVEAPPFPRPAVPAPDAVLDPAASAPVEAPAPVQAPAPVAAAVPPKAPGVPGAPSALRDAQGLEQKATQEMADLKERQFADIGKQQTDVANEQQARIDQSAAMLQERAAKQEKLYNDMLNAKVNPDHFWETRSTGQKVSAAIGLILGGIGAGLTKGPNYAMDVINKAIDRDMEAQKLGLQTKQNGLRMYMEQTRDLGAAQHALRADYYTAAAAKLQGAMSTMSGEQAQAAGALQLATLQRAALSETQQFVARKMQLDQEAKMQPLQLEQAQIGVRQARMGEQTQALTMKAIQQLTSGVASQGAQGQRLEPAAVEFLPKEFKERLVTMPDGSFSTARTPEAAKKVNDSFEAMHILREKMKRYGALLEKHPSGISSTLSPGDYETAQDLHASMLTDLNGIAGLNRFTGEEKKIYETRLRPITALGRYSGKKASLDEMYRELEDKVVGANNQFLNRSMMRRPGG